MKFVKSKYNIENIDRFKEILMEELLSESLVAVTYNCKQLMSSITKESVSGNKGRKGTNNS